MLKELLSILILCTCAAALSGQYIQSVLEYTPAPGQFLNLSSAGTPGASRTITGPEKGLVTLGAAGGYIVFQFDRPVLNHPDHPYGVDFTLFGNALPEWSEPGAVFVMEDENKNNKPDDTWYLLAGSDYFFSTTDKNHVINYDFPPGTGSDISWTNSLGHSGSLLHNSFHSQSYYPGNEFDAEFYSGGCSFELMRIEGNLDLCSSLTIKSYPRAFGFADNRPIQDPEATLPDNPYTWDQEGYGGDPFDLEWALDSDGNYVELDTAHFIKVQCSMYGIQSATGEISTELVAGLLSQPAPGKQGESRMLVVEEIPPDQGPGEYQLRAHYFEYGRKVQDARVSWSLTGEGQISESGRISLEAGMRVSVQAKLEGQDLVSQVLNICIPSELGTGTSVSETGRISLSPNPAGDELHISSPLTRFGMNQLSIVDLAGRLVFSERINQEYVKLDVSGLPGGIYLVALETGGRIYFQKFIKH